MYFKVFYYGLLRDGGGIPTVQHLRTFRRSTNYDAGGGLAQYRGRSDAILMEVRGSSSRFYGRIGRHSTERLITRYDRRVDEAREISAADDDYPNVMFLCVPELEMMACADLGELSANSAMRRLHAVLAHRVRCRLEVYPLRQVDDLRIATNRFNIHEVTYDVYRVNPHTGDLGRVLDENNKRDYIERLSGRAQSSGRPLKLNGGTLEQVAELQQSGHATVGYKAITGEGTEVSVQKPSKPREIDDSSPDEDHEIPELRLRMSNVSFPPSEDTLDELERIMRVFAEMHGRTQTR